LEPSKNSFYQAYKSRPESLLSRLRQDDPYRKEYRQAFMEQLRKEAGWHVNEEVRKTMDRRSELDEG
jgi:hypothetical protein